MKAWDTKKKYRIMFNPNTGKYEKFEVIDMTDVKGGE